MAFNGTRIPRTQPMLRMAPASAIGFKGGPRGLKVPTYHPIPSVLRSGPENVLQAQLNPVPAKLTAERKQALKQMMRQSGGRL